MQRDRLKFLVVGLGVVQCAHTIKIYPNLIWRKIKCENGGLSPSSSFSLCTKSEAVFSANRFWNRFRVGLRSDRCEQSLRARSHGVIFFPDWPRFFLLQQKGCTGLNGSVHTLPLWQHHQLLCSPLQAKPNRIRNQGKNSQCEWAFIVYLTLMCFVNKFFVFD